MTILLSIVLAVPLGLCMGFLAVSLAEWSAGVEFGSAWNNDDGGTDGR